MKQVRTLAISVILGLMSMGLGLSAHAAMVSNQALSVSSLSINQIQQTRSLIENQLVELGVEQLAARQRVERLTEQQIEQVHSRLQDLPAGADAAGVLLTIFIVFVITDIIGATDIFPFIHPVK